MLAGTDATSRRARGTVIDGMDASEDKPARSACRTMQQAGITVMAYQSSHQMCAAQTAVPSASLWTVTGGYQRLATR